MCINSVQMRQWISCLEWGVKIGCKLWKKFTFCFQNFYISTFPCFAFFLSTILKFWESEFDSLLPLKNPNEPKSMKNKLIRFFLHIWISLHRVFTSVPAMQRPFGEFVPLRKGLLFSSCEFVTDFSLHALFSKTT